MFICLALIDDPEECDLFVHLFMTYRQSLFLSARSILKDDASAEDAISQSYEPVAKHISKIAAMTEPEQQSYVYTIVTNKAKDIYRKRQREHELAEHLIVEDVPTTSCAPDTIVCAQDAYQRLCRQIASLSPNDREVLELRFVQHHSVAETADILCITENAVHVRTTRAREHLKKKMMEEESL